MLWKYQRITSRTNTKGVISIFETEFKFKIKSETNLNFLNFLDATLNLNTGTHEPYNKPNDNPLYINIDSNYLPNIIKNLPENTQKRITNLSSITGIFNSFFNPIYSTNVTTKIGNKFLQILGKHFPKSHKFHKLFNRNNIKHSYSSLPNFASIINFHNKKTERNDLT